jgi:transposase
MAAAKRYSPEQIVAKREHENLQGQGLTIPAAAKRLGISDQTFYR